MTSLLSRFARPAMAVAPLPAGLMAVLLSGLLVGCGAASPGASDKETEEAKVSIREGDCFAGQAIGDGAEDIAKEWGVDDPESISGFPTWRDQVDCNEDHLLHVHAVVKLPKALKKTARDYQDLVGDSAKKYGKIRRAITRRCSEQVNGIKPALASTDLKLSMAPALNADLAELVWYPFPPDKWESGKRKFACALKLDEPGTETLDTFMTKAGKRTELHLCYLDEKNVPCWKKHSVESVAILRANAAVKAGQLPDSKGFSAGRLQIPAATWAALDRVCTVFMEKNSKGLNKSPQDSTSKLTGVTSVYETQWPESANGNYAFYCDAMSPYGTPEEDIHLSKTSVFNK